MNTLIHLTVMICGKAQHSRAQPESLWINAHVLHLWKPGTCGVFQCMYHLSSAICTGQNSDKWIPQSCHLDPRPRSESSLHIATAKTFRIMLRGESVYRGETGDLALRFRRILGVAGVSGVSVPVLVFCRARKAKRSGFRSLLTHS